MTLLAMRKHVGFRFERSRAVSARVQIGARVLGHVVLYAAIQKPTSKSSTLQTQSVAIITHPQTSRPPERLIAPRALVYALAVHVIDVRLQR